MGSAQDGAPDADSVGMKSRQHKRNSKPTQRRVGFVERGFLRSHRRTLSPRLGDWRASPPLRDDRQIDVGAGIWTCVIFVRYLIRIDQAGHVLPAPMRGILAHQ